MPRRYRRLFAAREAAIAGLVRRLRSGVSRILPPPLRDLARSLDRARRGAPQIGLPAASGVLVLAAHPDDETAMCGGTIALLASRGTVVTVVVATDGQATSGGTSPAATGAARRAEVTAACALLGAGPPRLLGHVDGQLASVGKELEAELALVVGEVAPEVVIAPWWLDDHPDHRALYQAVARTTLPMGTTVWLGEIWTPLHPNRIVDITAVADQKRQALEVHRTANRAIDMDAMLGLSRYRSLFGLGGHGYAEAFVAVAAGDLGEWVVDSG